MRTEQQFNEYKNKVQHKQSAIDELVKTEDELKKSISQLDSDYKKALAVDDEKKAEQLFNERIKKESDFKQLSNKLTVKRDLLDAFTKEEKLKLFNNVHGLDELYSKDKEKLDSLIDKCIDELNGYLKQADDLEKEYRNELFEYSGIYNSLSKEEKRTHGSNFNSNTHVIKRLFNKVIKTHNNVVKWEE